MLLKSINYNNKFRKQSLKTPINLLTELVNTDEGTNRLIEENVIPKILDYITNNNEFKSLKLKKAAIWILGKICNF